MTTAVLEAKLATEARLGKKILTNYCSPWAWTASVEDAPEGSHGVGKTEEAAVQDLLDQLEEGE